MIKIQKYVLWRISHPCWYILTYINSNAICYWNYTTRWIKRGPLKGMLLSLLEGSNKLHTNRHYVFRMEESMKWIKTEEGVLDKIKTEISSSVHDIDSKFGKFVNRSNQWGYPTSMISIVARHDSLIGYHLVYTWFQLVDVNYVFCYLCLM